MYFYEFVKKFCYKIKMSKHDVWSPLTKGFLSRSKLFTQGVSLSGGTAHWTLPHEMCLLSKVDLAKLLHRGVNFKYSCLLYQSI